MPLDQESEVVAILRKVERLLEVLVRREVSDALKEELADPKVRLLYKLTGLATINELRKRTGFSAGKISGIWKKWESLGLVLKDGNRYRKVL